MGCLGFFAKGSGTVLRGYGEAGAGGEWGGVSGADGLDGGRVGENAVIDYRWGDWPEPRCGSMILVRVIPR